LPAALRLLGHLRRRKIAYDNAKALYML